MFDRIVDFVMDRYEEDECGFLVKVVAYSFIIGALVAIITYYI